MTIKEALNELKPCSKCHGRPVILYEPGSSLTGCWLKDPACPCLERAPDMDIELLAYRVNAKNNSFKNQ